MNFFSSVLKRCDLLVAILMWGLLYGNAAAAEVSGGWRPTYDLILRYINFLILVFLIFKYARKPLVNFFKEKSADVKKEIQQIEDAKKQAQDQVKALLEARDKNKDKLEQLKDRIISQGRAKQQDIIDDAKLESRLLLESAQRKVDNQILIAKNSLRMEMVDMAMDMAMKQLPEKITDQDNQNFIDYYLKRADSSQAPS